MENCQNLEELRQKLGEKERVQEVKKALDVVIGENFTGCRGVSFPIPSFFTEDSAREELSFNLNSPHVRARGLPHLQFCKDILLNDVDSLDSESSLLAFRIASVWQKLLMEPSIEIKEIIQKLVSRIDESPMNWDDAAAFRLGLADSHLTYYEYEQCQDSITKALEHAGLSVELAGKMGKRTKFQQKAVSQLVLEAASIARGPSEADDDVPQNCLLNDDTLLDKILILEAGDQKQEFTPVQLAALLALCRLEIRTQYHDDVLKEKCDAFLDTIIASRRCWAVQTAALLIRSSLEKKSGRRVERACSQSELLAKLMRGIDDTTPIEKRQQRSSMVLASGLNPFWHAQVVNAEILVSLGCTSEALLIYEGLELWDSVIDCYKGLGQLEKANSLIHKLLLERPNDSMLYVYLGDIGQDPSYYNKAIELSEDRNAKARKALGFLMLTRSQFKEAYDHFRRSLELQPIQLGVWYNAGHCAWKSEQYSDAVTCYHRCVSLEPEHFEAWNNLSAAYIRLGQKERARRILQEALKFNYEHSNVWENYLLLCVDTGDLSAAIKAYHRLIDLNKSQKDDEVLEILASQALKTIEEESEEELNELKLLREELIKLFARITTTQTLSCKVWSLYARLKKPPSNDVTEYEKYIQLLDRAVLSNSNKPDWYKTPEKCEETLQAALVSANEKLALAKIKGTEEAEKQARGRIKLTLRPMLTAADKHNNESPNEQVSSILEEVKQLLTSLA